MRHRKNIIKISASKINTNPLSGKAVRASPEFAEEEKMIIFDDNFEGRLMKITTIIFDLGDVLIRLHHGAVFESWAAATRKRADALADRFKLDETYEDLERGKCKPETYRKHLNKMLGIQLTRAQFEHGWNQMLGLEVPECAAAIRELRNSDRGFTLAMLTNTNLIHEWVWMDQLKATLMHFDAVFASHRIGLRKPDEACYRFVLDKLKVEPGACLFLDDRADHVAAARKIGIVAGVVDQPKKIARILKKLELI